MKENLFCKYTIWGIFLVLFGTFGCAKHDDEEEEFLVEDGPSQIELFKYQSRLNNDKYFHVLNYLIYEPRIWGEVLTDYYNEFYNKNNVDLSQIEHLVFQTDEQPDSDSSPLYTYLWTFSHVNPQIIVSANGGSMKLMIIPYNDTMEMPKVSTYTPDSQITCIPKKTDWRFATSMEQFEQSSATFVILENLSDITGEIHDCLKVSFKPNYSDNPRKFTILLNPVNTEEPASTTTKPSFPVSFYQLPATQKIDLADLKEILE